MKERVPCLDWTEFEDDELIGVFEDSLDTLGDLSKELVRRGYGIELRNPVWRPDGIPNLKIEKR